MGPPSAIKVHSGQEGKERAEEEEISFISSR